MRMKEIGLEEAVQTPAVNLGVVYAMSRLTGETTLTELVCADRFFVDEEAFEEITGKTCEEPETPTERSPLDEDCYDDVPEGCIHAYVPAPEKAEEPAPAEPDKDESKPRENSGSKKNKGKAGKRKNIDRAKVWELLDAGLNQQEIADEVGCSNQNISLILKKGRPVQEENNEG